MIIWNDKMFVTEGAREKLNKIKKKLEKPDKIRFGAYLITLSSNGKDLFDIYNLQFFPSKHFKYAGYDANIVGVAESMEEASKLVGNIVLAFEKKYGEISHEKILEYFNEV